ncbi:NAD-dependent epimerase/dehydratase family protein [Cylindrospermum sp. FACHB-282]|nr:NAD-dependent epimerase/dehydratase family protein [Cylindrospermum sp. FACHB-282]
MRVFVTGGNGFLGSSVVRTLVDKGYKVRCLLRSTSNTSRIDGLPIERVLGDIHDLSSVEAGMIDCDAVIHLAGISDWKEVTSSRMHESIVVGTQNVLNTAVKLEQRRFVYISTISAVNGTNRPVLQNEDTPCTLNLNQFAFVKAKREAEALCFNAASLGASAIVVCPPETFGPNDIDLITSQNLINWYKQLNVLVSKGGVSVGYVDDVAVGIVAALERGRPGNRYILGGENVTVKQIAALMFDILGEKRNIIEIPNPIINLVTKVACSLHIPLPYNPEVVPYATRFWFMDNSKTVKELGVSFRSVREALIPTLAWLKEKHFI